MNHETTAEKLEKLNAIEDSFDEFSALKKNASMEEIDNLVERYQDACAEYAYSSSFYPSSSLHKRAADLVFQGRRIVYGAADFDIFTFRHLETLQESFEKTKMYILCTTLIALVSVAITALVVAIEPSIGWYFLSEEAVLRLEQGEIWTDRIQGLSAISSSKIATNNIRVAFMSFVLGLFGGIGTIILIAINGAMLGGVFSFIHQYGMAWQLLDFIMAHGVLELSAIFVAGGAGLYLGDGLLRPGNMNRKISLQSRARPALVIVFYCALWLVPAGLVEGYVSPYDDIPFVIKAVIGVVLALVFWRIMSGGKSKEMGRDNQTIQGLQV